MVPEPVNNWKGLFALAIPKFGHDGWSTPSGVCRLAAPKAFNPLPGETLLLPSCRIAVSANG